MTEILSISERNFVLKCLTGNKRLDGRSFTDFRELSIHFGSEWGCAYVTLGETRILAQVSCEITQPRATRPTEGVLYINVNSGMEKRSSEQVVLLTRNLERAFKESRCVDLESLCIKAEEKVWKLRVDINILNHEGNLIDCASVAALAALLHFKRPDVTTNDHEIIVHSFDEKDAIPIVLHHYPVCVSYAFFNSGKTVIADPSLIEERIAEATAVFGLNSYRELCGLHFGGVTLASVQVLIKCATQGAKRATSIVKLIKDKLEEDTKMRLDGITVGFVNGLQSDAFDFNKDSRLILKLANFKLNPTSEDYEEIAKMELDKLAEIKPVSKYAAVLLPAEEIANPVHSPKWIPDDENDDDDELAYDIQEAPPQPKKLKKGNKPNKKKVKAEAMSEDSEEDETMTLDSSKLAS